MASMTYDNFLSQPTYQMVKPDLSNGVERISLEIATEFYEKNKMIIRKMDTRHSLFCLFKATSQRSTERNFNQILYAMAHGLNVIRVHKDPLTGKADIIHWTNNPLKFSETRRVVDETYHIPCRYGAGCRKKNDGFRFNHPEKDDDTILPSVMAVFSEAKKMTGECRYGTGCRKKNDGCRFKHPEKDDDDISESIDSVLSECDI